MIKKIYNTFILKYPILVLLLLSLFVSILGYYSTKVEVDASAETLLLDDAIRHSSSSLCTMYCARTSRGVRCLMRRTPVPGPRRGDFISISSAVRLLPLCRMKFSNFSRSTPASAALSASDFLSKKKEIAADNNTD